MFLSKIYVVTILGTAAVILLSAEASHARDQTAGVQCGPLVCGEGQTCVEGCGSFSCEGNSLPNLLPKLQNCGGIRVTTQNMTVTITPDPTAEPEKFKPHQ